MNRTGFCALVAVVAALSTVGVSAQSAVGQQLSAYLKPGRAVDVTQFSHLRPIEFPTAPDSVAVMPLDAAVLAKARPDLGDVRVIDANARLTPFLIEGKGAEAKLYIVAPGSSYVLLVGNPALEAEPQPIDAARALVLSATPLALRVEPLLHNPDERPAASASVAKAEETAATKTNHAGGCSLRAPRGDAHGFHALAIWLTTLAVVAVRRSSRRPALAPR